MTAEVTIKEKEFEKTMKALQSIGAIYVIQHHRKSDGSKFIRVKVSEVNFKVDLKNE